MKTVETLPDIIIPDPERVAKLRTAFISGGPEHLHILADFDRTLTKGRMDGKNAPSVIAQIRAGGYLTPDYAKRAYTLHDKFAPFERALELPFEERAAKMRAWWDEHNNLLVECGLTEAVLDTIVAKRALVFRPGVLALFDLLQRHSIPLIIMSAGPADMIAKYLKREERLYPNIHIIANWFIFDNQGKMIGGREPIIHSLNKYEITVEDFPAHREVQKRRNVLLLGDNADDVGMIEGFPFENLIKIGFLNEHTKLLEEFKKRYDVIITPDAGVEYITKFVNEIIGETS